MQKTHELEPGVPLANSFFGRLSAEAVEEHAQLARPHWEVEITQITRGPLQVELNYLNCGRVLIYRDTWNVSLHIRASVQPGVFALALPLRSSGSNRWWGQERRPDEIPCLRAGEEAEVVTGTDYETLMVLADQELLLEVASWYAPDQTHWISQPFHLLRVDPTEVDRLAQELTHWLSHPPVASRAERLGLHWCTRILDLLRDGTAPALAPASRASLVRRAIELADGKLNQAGMSELCQALHVGRRTLEYAFRQHLGTTPHHYFRLQRFARAHRNLLQSDPGQACVTDIATQFGFNELGRFAGEYRQLFGERPSDTLRRQARTLPTLPALTLTS
ncbi:MAG: helix-turn-helix domain-containing protein [Verrucomicrobia bacterium]|nr:helix-turn-helix domain-containing protein [Verrucomicrobiota bacterium]